MVKLRLMRSWLSELICPNANNLIGVVMTLRATNCKGGSSTLLGIHISVC